jgi:hypothetical protein
MAYTYVGRRYTSWSDLEILREDGDEPFTTLGVSLHRVAMLVIQSDVQVGFVCFQVVVMLIRNMCYFKGAPLVMRASCVALLST